MTRHALPLLHHNGKIACKAPIFAKPHVRLESAVRGFDSAIKPEVENEMEMNRDSDSGVGKRIGISRNMRPGR
jgi:hypothetical protein